MVCIVGKDLCTLAVAQWLTMPLYGIVWEIQDLRKLSVSVANTQFLIRILKIIFVFVSNYVGSVGTTKECRVRN